MSIVRMKHKKSCVVYICKKCTKSDTHDAFHSDSDDGNDSDTFSKKASTYIRLRKRYFLNY